MKAVNHYVIVDKIKTEQKKVAGLIMTEDLDEDNNSHNNTHCIFEC